MVTPDGKFAFSWATFSNESRYESDGQEISKYTPTRLVFEEPYDAYSEMPDQRINNLLQAIQAEKAAYFERSRRAQYPVIDNQEICPVPPPQEMSSDFFSRHCANFEVVSVRCVENSSHQTYSVGYRAWMVFCAKAEIDPQLLESPPDWMHRRIRPGFPVYALGAFLAFLHLERRLQPATASNYLTGVRHMFRAQLLNTDIFEHPMLKNQRRAMTIMTRATHGLDSSTRRLPFTLEMLAVMRKFRFGRQNLTDRGIIMATMLGLLCLLRSSETIYTPADHYLRTQDIQFEESVVYGVTPKFIPAHKAGDVRCQHLSGIMITVRSAKNDQEGVGHKYYFKRHRESPTHAFCIVEEAWQWALLARPYCDHPFLSSSVGTGTWKLSYHTYSNAIKATAKDCGFSPEDFGTHSVRIGGVCILAVADRPAHFIQDAGRWKGDSYLIYMRKALKTMEDNLKLLVNPSIFTNDDIRRLHISL